MKKNLLKLIIAITAFSLTAATVVGSITFLRSSEYLEKEIESNVQNYTEKYANQISGIFNHTEGMVDSLASFVSVTFDPDELEKNPAYMDEYKETLKKVVSETISTTTIANGLYVTFNPELTPNDDEVWYQYKDGEVIYMEADFEGNTQEFDKPYSDATQFYFLPIRTGRAVWTNPYFDDNQGANVLSYSKAIYAGDTFVGVAGADVTAEDTTDIVLKMNPYDDSLSMLLNEDLEFIIKPDNVGYRHLEQMIPQSYESVASQIRQDPFGKLRLIVDGEEYITGFARLNNGWILSISHPPKHAFASIHNLNRVLIILGSIITLLVLAFAIFFSISFSRPIDIRQSALEAQNREKDILLIYQSRQAKIGEMVGNIAHQWKQPLNIINIITANMIDAYDYGELDEKRLSDSVDKIRNITANMSETISDFTGFLTPAGDSEGFDIHIGILKALSLMEESLQKHNIKIEYEKKKNCAAYGSLNEFTHVLFNVIDNARDAILSESPEFRQIDIIADTDNGNLLIKITNRCCSIDESVLPRVFNPYYTTKPEKGGTGIGLYISKVIIEHRLNGTIKLYNTQDGVCCEIKLPCLSEAANKEEDNGTSGRNT